jgi:hypothetical protein
MCLVQFVFLCYKGWSGLYRIDVTQNTVRGGLL